MITKKAKGHVIKPDGSKSAIRCSHSTAVNVPHTKSMKREQRCAESVIIERIQFSRTVYRNMYEQEERDIERAVRVLAKYAP